MFLLEFQFELFISNNELLLQGIFSLLRYSNSVVIIAQARSGNKIIINIESVEISNIHELSHREIMV